MRRNILGSLLVISVLTFGAALPALAGPDLYVSEFQLSPDPPVQGQPVQVRIGIYNRGNSRSGKYKVAWWPGESFPIAKQWVIDGSNARGGRILTYTYPGYKSWYSRLVTKVAIKHKGTEDNLDNNIFRKTISVIKP